MEYQKSWKGTLPNGEYEIRYNGDSTPVLKDVIETMQLHIKAIEDGIIEE